MSAPRPAPPLASGAPAAPGRLVGLAGEACACSLLGQPALGRSSPAARRPPTPATLQADPEAEQRLDEEAGSLVDLILGTAPSPPPAAAGSSAATGSSSAAAARSWSVPARLDRLAAPRGLRASRSRPALEAADAAAGSTTGASPRSGGGGAAAAPEACAICMDRPVRVGVAGCEHELCFGCARRLCASPDHAVPQCPFCRQVRAAASRGAGRPGTCPLIRGWAARPRAHMRAAWAQTLTPATSSTSHIHPPLQAIDGFVALASGRLVDGSACAPASEARPAASAAAHA